MLFFYFTHILLLSLHSSYMTFLVLLMLVGEQGVLLCLVILVELSLPFNLKIPENKNHSYYNISC